MCIFVQRSEKGSDLLEWDLETAVSCCVGSENQMQIIKIEWFNPLCLSVSPPPYVLGQVLWLSLYLAVLVRVAGK